MHSLLSKIVWKIIAISLVSISIISISFFKLSLYNVERLALGVKEKCENWDNLQQCCKTFKNMRFCFQYDPPYLTTFCNKTQTLPDIEQSIDFQREGKESYQRNCSYFYFKASWIPRENKVELEIEDKSKPSISLTPTQLAKELGDILKKYLS